MADEWDFVARTARFAFVPFVGSFGHSASVAVVPASAELAVAFVAVTVDFAFAASEFVVAFVAAGLAAVDFVAFDAASSDVVEPASLFGFALIPCLVPAFESVDHQRHLAACLVQLDCSPEALVVL